MFTTTLKAKVLSKLYNIAAQRPHLCLMRVVMKLRESNHPEIIEQVNYCSYLIEANPGLASKPFLLWPLCFKI